MPAHRHPARIRALAAACALFAPLAHAHADEADRIVGALAVRPGMSVADVGAGEGRYTTALAKQVGASGRVYATEVESDKLEQIRKKVKADGIANVSTVLGDQDHTGLPERCCDAILLRMVYHHFTDPSAMRRSLWSALRPGGRVLVVEVPPHSSWRKLEGVPERGGHGIPAVELIADMRSQGFTVVAQDDDWPGGEDDSYGVVFQRPELTRTVPASSAPTASSAGTGDSSASAASTISAR
jgi:protein-L-isoaspartate O-methyltransferase